MQLDIMTSEQLLLKAIALIEVFIIYLLLKQND